MIEENEVRYEADGIEDAEVVCVAYGTTARVVKNAIEELEKEGIKVGLIRPITLWPFPNEAFDKINPKAKGLLTVEMSMGQMIDDVKIASNGRWTTNFHGKCGGLVPSPAGVIDAVKKIIGGDK